MGKAYSNNLINSGVFRDYKEAFEKMGIDFDDIFDEESDPGLGSGELDVWPHASWILCPP